MGNTESLPDTPTRGELPEGEDIAKVKCQYLGSSALSASRSGDYILQAAKRIADLRREPLPILLRISTTGVFLRRETGALVTEIGLSDLSHVNLVSSNKVVYLQRDAQSGCLSCHLFFMGRNAKSICDTINKACKDKVGAVMKIATVMEHNPNIQDDDLDDNNVDAEADAADTGMLYSVFDLSF